MIVPIFICRSPFLSVQGGRDHWVIEYEGGYEDIGIIDNCNLSFLC